MEENSSIKTLRPQVRQVLLWTLRIAAVAIVFLVAYLGYHLWMELSAVQRNASKNIQEQPDFRGVGLFDINDTTSRHQETVRWVNLFLDDVIITSNHPLPLHVESAPATKVLKDVAPDDAPSRVGHAMSAGIGDAPPPVRRHRAHGGDDDDSDSISERRISFRASLQGIKRFGAMVRFPMGKRWSLETGLTYGNLKTEDNRNSCFAIPLKGIYDIKSFGPVDMYALGGGTIEKICKGSTSLQLLLQAGIGAEYKFSKKWGVFLEPSLRYHVGNDNNIPELYGKRLGVNIHFGITFTP